MNSTESHYVKINNIFLQNFNNFFSKLRYLNPQSYNVALNPRSTQTKFFPFINIANSQFEWQIARMKRGTGSSLGRCPQRWKPSCKDDEAAKRTLMVSLCSNERSIIILGSLSAVLIKIARLARYLSTSPLYCYFFSTFSPLSIPFANDFRLNIHRITESRVKAVTRPATY